MKVSVSIAAAAALLPIAGVLAAEQAKPVSEGSQAAQVSFKPTTVKGLLVEQFDDGWDKRWTVSSEGKIDDTDTGTYKGEWAVELPTRYPAITGDKGLVLKSESRRHAISALLPKPVDNEGKTFVVQYEVKPQQDIKCAGSYLKLLRHDPDFDPAHFSEKSPYVIMFGPDRCGPAQDKVHFILNRKSRETGEYVEHHLTKKVTTELDQKTTLYRLVITENQGYQVLVNDKIAAEGSLFDAFVTPINPPEKIADPEDKKPADWVDDYEILDPEASKPEDWDETEPLTIADPDAVKPADWLDDEPTVIPDPNVTKPEDWDDEEDGVWTAPSIPNPKCVGAESGCGEWKAPLVANPKYKGEWNHPKIRNPDYKGPWVARDIPNPNYEKHSDLTPSNLEPIGAIGFELWAVENGTLFDNIYIGHSVEDADKLKAETFDIKRKIEEDLILQAQPKKDQELPADEKDDFISFVRQQVLAFIDALQIDPVGAVQAMPAVAGGLGAGVAIALLVVLSLFKSSAPAVEPQAAKKAETDGPATAKKDEAATAESTGAQPAQGGEATKRR